MTAQKSRPGEKAANPNENSFTLAARSDIAPYDYPLDPIYEAKLLAWAQGWESRRAEIYHANAEADRYYAEMCRRPAPRQPNYVSHADLERIRGNDEHADQIVAANARRFAEVSL